MPASSCSPIFISAGSSAGVPMNPVPMRPSQRAIAALKYPIAAGSSFGGIRSCRIASA